MDEMIAPYGAWRSPITAELSAAASIGLGRTQINHGTIYWLERRPAERGRNVIVSCDADGSLTDLTPPEFNVRSRVHEYGGADYIVADGTIYFANFSDQRVYRQTPGGTPEAMTPDGSVMRYADFCIDRSRNRLLCVREDHSGAGEAVNTLVAIDLAEGGPGEVLASGYDFYSTPRLSPAGNRLAWLSWRHPNMPWDGTELWVGELEPNGYPRDMRIVAGGLHESVFQPEWSPGDQLHFVSDRTGWWNVNRVAGEDSEALYPMEAEFGQPHWQFDVPLYGFFADGRILCTYMTGGNAHIGLLDPGARTLTETRTPLTSVSELRVGAGFAVVLGGAPNVPRSVLRLDFSPTGEVSRRVLRASARIEIDPAYLSLPERLEYPTERGLTAFAYLYRPRNPHFRAPDGERPPLLVLSHGGPTGATAPVLNLGLQFWTSRGFAVLDVDYGGSSGYGRAYRDRLYGQWGVVDLEDCVNGALHLARQGEVDGERLAIRGGSAGGYTTLCALTFTDVFRAGASYFGVSDLEALVEDTHKFESRYTFGLVGPYPERKDLYEARSPIHFTDRLSCPLILFQGLDDPVVPPAQSQMMYDALREKGMPVAYVAFPGEQHGFRQTPNMIRSMEAELYFYGKVFGFEPADEIEPVEIANLPPESK